MTLAQIYTQWQRTLATSGNDNTAKLAIFREAAFDIGLRILGNGGNKADVNDKLVEVALAHGFFGLEEQEIEEIIADGLLRAEREREDRVDRERLYREADEKVARARMNGNGKSKKPQAEGGYMKEKLRSPAMSATSCARSMWNPSLPARSATMKCYAARCCCARCSRRIRISRRSRSPMPTSPPCRHGCNGSAFAASARTPLTAP